MGMLLGTRRALLGVGASFYAVLFNGTTIIVNGGSEAGLDDLPTGANGVTVEGWFRLANAGEGNYSILFAKGSSFYLRFNASFTSMNVRFSYSITSIFGDSIFTPGITADTWHHFAVTYDENGDRKARIWIDGLLKKTSGASVGNYVTDAAADFTFGNFVGTGNTIDGAMGWQRVSNTIRYNATFTPPSILNPPAVDGNTVLQYNFDEGSGVTLDNAEGTAARDGTIANGVWVTIKI